MKAKIFYHDLVGYDTLGSSRLRAERKQRQHAQSCKSGTSAAQYGSPVPHSGSSSVSGNYRSLVSTAVSIKPQGTVIPVRAQYGTAAGNAPAFCRNVTEGTDRDNIPPFGYAAGEARNSTAPSGIVFTKSRYFIQTPTGSAACSSAPSSACTAPRSYASAAASSVATGFRASSRLFAPSPSLLFQ